MSHPQSTILLLLFFIPIITSDFTETNEISIWHDYSPPSPPPPSPIIPPTYSCESDLNGLGSFDTLCLLNSTINLSTHVHIKGNGSLHLLPDVNLTCTIKGCIILLNLSGNITLESHSAIIAGTIRLSANSVIVGEGAELSSSGLAGAPPEKTSGAATGVHGDGGGYGGRGASCYVREGQREEDSWGGDAYDWAGLTRPESYGSKGGSTSLEEDFGGGGGGAVWMEVDGVVEVEGRVCADGGDGGRRGGGGSGGSVYISAAKM